MEGKKHMVPRKICAVHSEKNNRFRRLTLNTQKSAKGILAESFFSEGLESLVRDTHKKSAERKG